MKRPQSYVSAFQAFAPVWGRQRVELGARRWYRIGRRGAQPRRRLFCFPYAGGNASAFEQWPHALPPDVEVWAAQLPGRPPRMGDGPIKQLRPLLDGLEAEMTCGLDLPYAFFGHSMGAVVAFELARRLRRRGLPPPTHLFVSGHAAPQIIDDHEQLHLMPDRKLVEELRKLGGMPDPICADQHLVDFLLPIIRTDLEALETWPYVAEDPLRIAIHAFGGLDDRTVGRNHLEAWRKQTEGPFSMHLFPGDHFFISSAEDLVVDTVSRKLARGL